MKTAAIIKKVNQFMHRLEMDNIAIYLGVLSESQLADLRKTFDVKRGHFGYWEFKKLTAKR